jgi:hypothetical protein
VLYVNIVSKYIENQHAHHSKKHLKKSMSLSLKNMM